MADSGGHCRISLATLVPVIVLPGLVGPILSLLLLHGHFIAPLVVLACAGLSLAASVTAGLGLATSVRRISLWVNDFEHKTAFAPLPETGLTELSSLARGLNRMGRGVERKLARLADSEKRFRELVETMIEGLVVVDRRERITFVNRRFAELLATPAESLVGQEIFPLLDEANRRILLAQTEQRRAGVSSSYELTWRKADGEPVVTLVSAAPLTDGEGRFQGSFAVITDLTDRRRLEQQMSRAEKFRALGEMAGGIAHEINNRLTSILGNAQLLLLDAGDERTARSLRVIEESAMEGAETVRKVLELARTRPRSVREDVDLNTLLDDVIQLVRFRWKDEAEEKGISYRIRRELGAKRPVSCYPSELREALVNVVTNAFDGMPEGGELRVAAFDCADGVGVEIADTGQGMAPETVERAFDPFFTTRGVSSTGLGLSIAYGIVHRVDGSISIRSTLGRGTTVSFRLPASRMAPAAGRADPKGSGRGGSRGARILVVDDEEGIVRLVELALTRRGHRVESARSGAEALAILLGGQRFDLLLTDLGVPGVPGTELAERAKDQDPDLRVVLCTGWGLKVEEDVARCRAVDVVIRKPFGLNDLVEQIEGLLGARKDQKTSTK